MKKNIFLFALILLSLLFTVNSCQKDGDSLIENFPKTNPSYLKNNDDIPLVFSSFKDDLPDIESKVIAELLNFTEERATFTKISNGSVIKTRSGANDIYSIFFDVEYGALLKLIVEVNPAQEIENLFVIKITPTQEFRGDYFLGIKTINDFTGDMDYYTVGDYFDSVSGTNPQIEWCWKLVFGSSSSPGGGSTPGNPGSISGVTIVSAPSGGSGIINGTDCTYLGLQQVCGCNPQHVGGNSNPNCHCHAEDIYVGVWDCIEPFQGNDSNTENQSIDNFNSSKNISISYWECINLLDNIGLLNDADIYKARLRNCEGYDTPYDVDPQSGGNENTIHPDYDFCETWITYRDNCLSTSTVTEDYNAQIEVWADLMLNHRNLFNAIVEKP